MVARSDFLGRIVFFFYVFCLCVILYEFFVSYEVLVVWYCFVLVCVCFLCVCLLVAIVSVFYFLSDVVLRGAVE